MVDVCTYFLRGVQFLGVSYIYFTDRHVQYNRHRMILMHFLLCRMSRKGRIKLAIVFSKMGALIRNKTVVRYLSELHDVM